MTARKHTPWQSLSGEVWKAYPTDPRFVVSSFGRVRFQHKAPKNIQPQKNGYYWICSTLNGVRVAYSIGCMVLEAFKGFAPEHHECSHQDGDPGNNRLSNLEWETHKENCAKKVVHGTQTRGEQHPRAKLSALDILAIRKSSLSSRSIAPVYGVAHAYIRHLRRHGRIEHAKT